MGVAQLKMSAVALGEFATFPLSLQDQCLLTIACHVPTYSIETLALVPPRLRAIIALNMCAIDLHRIEKCSSFIDGLGGTMNIETLWKRRYETTLTRFSNVAGLDLDLDTHRTTRSLSLSSKDRYLTACLLGIPHTYSIDSTALPWGVALFGLTDVTVTNGQCLKDNTVHTIRHGLHCFRGRSSSTLSCNFISGHYLKLLDSNCSWRVGTEWPLHERVSLFTHLFPGWVPPYIPIQYDEISSAISTVAPEEVGGAIVYSGWYERRHHAEINETDQRPVVLSESFKSFFKMNSKSLDTIILLAPAVQKCIDSDGQQCIQPLSVTTTILTEFICTALPTLRHLSIAMHWADTSSLAVLPQALTCLYNTLQTLHLRIVRPKFSEPCTYTTLGQGLADLYRNCHTFEDLILQGLSFDDKGFIEMMLAYLNTPPTNDQSQHSLVLRTIKIWEGEGGEDEQQTIETQVMPKECYFNKSLYLHRIMSGLPFTKLFSSYEDVFFKKVTLSSLQSSAGPLFPLKVKFHVNSVLIEKTALQDDTFEYLQPLLSSDIQCVDMSLEGVWPLTLYKKCFHLCQHNLRQLEFNLIPGTVRSLQDLEYIFVAMFTHLPASTLAQLELNVTQLMTNLSTQISTGNRIGLGRMLVQNVVGKIVNQINITTLTRTWQILHKSWASNPEGCTKMKSLHVPTIVMEEMYEELSEMANELIEDII